MAGGLVCCDCPSLQAVQSPAATSSWLVAAQLTSPPPSMEVVLQALEGLVPRPPLLGLSPQSDVQAHKASLRPAGHASLHRWELPHVGREGVPQAHLGWVLSSWDPSALLQAPLAVLATPCCVLELHRSQKDEHPRTDLRTS